MTATGTGTDLTAEERSVVLRALQHPRGRYDADRASQLSGIPARILHDWATAEVLVPDWVGTRRAVDEMSRGCRATSAIRPPDANQARPEIRSDLDFQMVVGTGVDPVTYRF